MKKYWIIRKAILEIDFSHCILKADWEKAFGWTKNVPKLDIRVF